MKKTYNAPKGSYHNFCRKLYGLTDSSQPIKPATTNNFQIKSKNKASKSVAATERTRKLEDYHTFQEYLGILQNNQKDKLRTNDISKSKKLAPKTSRQLTLREKMIRNDQSDILDIKKAEKKDRQINQMKKNRQKKEIAPFLPYFKVRLSSCSQQPVQSKGLFRIDNRKFKLKSLLIEQSKLTQRWNPVS